MTKHILKKGKKLKMPKILVISLSIVATFIVGVVLGKTTQSGPFMPSDQTAQSTQQQTYLSNPLFKTQSATFQGKIQKVNGSILEVESETGQKGKFELAEKVIIYKFAPDSPTASASQELKDIEAEKLVLISLELVNGTYKAVSISYFRQAP